MIQFKRIAAAVLACGMTVSFAACSSSNGSNSGAGGGASQESSDAPVQSSATTIDDEIENPVDVSEVSIEAGDKVEPADLIYLGNYDITTAPDIKPAYKYFQENYGCNISCTIVSSLQIEEKLTTAISSGESPDLVDHQNNTFPLLMSKNMYTDLSPYMDLSAPQWSGLEKYVNRYKWGGKNYYYPWAYNISPEFLVYNRGLFEELNIDDPKELYDEGNWTWDTFKSCLQKFVDSDDDREGLYGYAATSFFDSTGTSFLSIAEDGTLECNLVNPDIERAANFMQELRSEGLTKTPEGYINVDTLPITTGISAFQAMGEWILAGYSKLCLEDSANNFFFVPFPRDPNADKYYYGVSTFGYLVPAGSKYAEQACVFINCCRLSVTDEELKAITAESLKKKNKLTDEFYEAIMDFHNINNYDAVIDEPYGLDENTADLITKMLDNVLFATSDEEYSNMSWAQMREANSAAIMSQVDHYNQLISSGNATE